MKFSFQSFRKKIQETLEAKAQKRSYEAATILRSHLMESLSNQPERTGRKYKIPGTNREYTASAPGEYPALREGYLRAKVGDTPIKTEMVGDVVRAELDVGAPQYGLILEAGLRPWFSKAAEEKRDEMEKVLRKRWF